MRSFLCFLLAASVACAAAGADKKTRADMERIDARVSTINFSIRQNTIKLAQLKTDAILLQEKVNLAKDPANRARLEKAFENIDEKRRVCEATIAHQQRTVNDLLATRQQLSGGSPPEPVQRNTAENTTSAAPSTPTPRAPALAGRPERTYRPLPDQPPEPEDLIPDADELLPYVPHHKK